MFDNKTTEFGSNYERRKPGLLAEIASITSGNFQQKELCPNIWKEAPEVSKCG